MSIKRDYTDAHESHLGNNAHTNELTTYAKTPLAMAGGLQEKLNMLVLTGVLMGSLIREGGRHDVDAL